MKKEIRYLNSYAFTVYDQLYEIPEFDSFREQLKSYFEKRYDIDYISMHIINKDRNFMFYRMDQDGWHEWCVDNHLDLFNYPVLLRTIDHLQPNKVYVEYFDSWMQTDATKIRANIFGIRKYGGCDLIFTNNDNDIIFYHITFKDDRSFGELMNNILNELIQDLIRYKNIYTPFVRYLEMGEDILDKTSLHKHLNKFKMDNRDLFHMI